MLIETGKYGFAVLILGTCVAPGASSFLTSRMKAVGVLAAAILSMPTAEVINSAVIAGPADVSVTCGDTTGSCFISFKKDSN